MKKKYFDDHINYYSSMVDLMAGILFIMIILLMGFVIQENVQKHESAQETVENNVDTLKNKMIENLSIFLTSKDIKNNEYLNEGALLIPADGLFKDQGVELTEQASKVYNALSQGLSFILTQTNPGKESLARGLLNKISIEVHSLPKNSDEDVLSWGRTLTLYGALLTAEKNASKNQLMILKNKNAHTLVAAEKFANNGSNFEEFIQKNISRQNSQIQKTNYILIRFKMFYPE